MKRVRPLIAPRVAVLDAGGQYVDLVKKAVERHGVAAKVLPLNTSRVDIEKTYGAIIISGSPASSHSQAAPQPDPTIWDSPLPLLGICYGMQALVTAHGGVVARNGIREDGRVTTHVNVAHPLFKGTKQDFTGLFTHGDFVKSLPASFRTLGSHRLSDGSLAYSSVVKDNNFGVQFHPEVFDDTPEGYQLFHNFLETIAGLKPDKGFRRTQQRALIAAKRQHIKDQAAGRPVIAFISGGVDSSVATALAAAVIDKAKLHAFYIDSGFMRDEDDAMVEALQAAGLVVRKIDATADFEHGTVEIDGIVHGPLTAITEPEIKRKIIGKTFIDIQNRLLRELKLDDALLLQGTNAADRIESGHSTGDGHTMTIKTHHNQVKEVQALKASARLIEPLDDLFKDEIRTLGRALGLPAALVQRQPFPGPGLAIRIIAAAKSGHPKSMPGESAIQKFLDDKYPEITARLLPIRSVGVGGDERSHLSVVALGPGNLTAVELAKIGADLPAHFRETVNRVIYALGPQPLTNLAVTRTLLTADVRAQLRAADRIVFEEMRATEVLGHIKQFPVVLLPVSFGSKKQHSIVLRPVTTSTFMTVQAMLPGRDLPPEFLERISSRILQEVPDISQVFLDLTNKPPATTEWE